MAISMGAASVSSALTSPAAANLLTGYLGPYISSQPATTLITVPANRTWIGKVGASCSVRVTAGEAGAGQAKCVFTVAGATATPAAGTLFAVEAAAAGNAATGAVGSQGNVSQSEDVVVIAGASAATIQVTTTEAGSAPVVHAWALGQLVPV